MVNLDDDYDVTIIIVILGSLFSYYITHFCLLTCACGDHVIFIPPQYGQFGSSWTEVLRCWLHSDNRSLVVSCGACSASLSSVSHGSLVVSCGAVFSVVLSGVVTMSPVVVILVLGFFMTTVYLQPFTILCWKLSVTSNLL